MDGLTTAIPLLHAALTGARRGDYEHIAEARRSFGFVGVHGEPEVGTTKVVENAIRFAGTGGIRVDLDIDTDEDGVAQSLARGLARQVLGTDALSQMAAPDLLPAWAQQRFVDLTERVGRPVAQLGFDTEADPVPISAVMEAIAAVYEHEHRRPVLWIDSLQAPLVVSRHQVDVDALLWNVRATHQQIEMPVIVSSSRAASRVAHGKSRAFYGDGAWVTLGRPGLDVWQEVGRSLDPEPTATWIRQMAEITHAHPQSMLLALALRVTLPESWSPLELWQFMLSLDAGHTARAMQHARSLHRLGGDLFAGLSRGIGPYEGARTKAAQMERQRAVRRLHEGGLITQPRPRAWEITNPLLAGRLRGQMPLTSSEAGPFEVPDEEDPPAKAFRSDESD